MINKKHIFNILEPFHSMFGKIFFHFFKVDALFILGLYVINVIGGVLFSHSRNIALVLGSIIFLTFLILVAYTFCKSLQYKKIEKKIKHHEILGKHLFIAIIMGVIVFVLVGFMLKVVELFFQIQYVSTIQKIIGGIMIFYFYLLFLNTHNYDHHSSLKAIINSAKTLKLKTTIKIIYFDLVYLASIYILHNIFIFMFQFLFIYMNIASEILNPIFVFIETLIYVIFLIAILSINKIIIYDIDLTKSTKKNKIKKSKK